MDKAELYSNNNAFSMTQTLKLLEKYVYKINWNGSDRVADVGAGDGAVTTNVLKKFMPQTFVKLLGCDISENMVKFANERYRDERTSFQVLDIAGELPEELRGAFDHVFSFFTIQIVYDQQRAFHNIYDMLSRAGDVLVVFPVRHPWFTMYQRLTNDSKWQPYNKLGFSMPKQIELEEKVETLKNMMTTAGFDDILVELNEGTFEFSTITSFRDAVSSVVPVQVSADRQEELLDDCIDLIRDQIFIGEANESGEQTVRFDFVLVVCYGRK